MKYVRSKLRILCVKTWWTLLVSALRLLCMSFMWIGKRLPAASLNIITETSHWTFQAFCSLSNRLIEHLQSDRESRALAFLINVQINNGIYTMYWLAIKNWKRYGEVQSSSKRFLITVKVCFEMKFFIFSGNTQIIFLFIKCAGTDKNILLLSRTPNKTKSTFFVWPQTHLYV